MSNRFTDTVDCVSDYILNSPGTFITDSLRGFVAAHPDIVWQSAPGLSLIHI